MRLLLRQCSFAAPLRCLPSRPLFTCRAVSLPQTSILPPEQRQQIDLYIETLLEWNKNLNLTAITDRDEAYVRHVEDSLALLPALDSCAAASGAQDVRLIDVGSGAGLPGIILAIARPQWRVTLLDSLKKRCNFVEAALEATGLQNVGVEWGRAEDAGRDPLLRDGHDLAVARAVAETRVLAELCLPLVRVGGFWVAAKGTNPEEEVAAAGPAIKLLGGRLVGVERVESEAPDGQRCVVIVKKEVPTSNAYPRRPGTPKKQPL